jgi:Na+/melibiose symporter-like transporter
MSVTDPEWHDLMEAWQSEAPEEAAPAPLSDEVRRRIRQRVRRQSYRQILAAVSQIAMAVAMLVWLWLTLDFSQPVDLVAMVGVVILIGFAMTCSLRIFRGTWWPESESTTTFVELSIERCRRKLQTLRAGRRFLAGELAFMIPWSIWALLARKDRWALKG